MNFYWRSFVREACSVFATPLEEVDNMPEKVMLNKSKGKFVALSNVHDYIYRPSAFASVNLYDWIRCANKKRKPSKRRKNDKPEIQDEMAEQANDFDNDTDPEDELDIIGDTCGSGPLRCMAVTSLNLFGNIFTVFSFYT